METTAGHTEPQFRSGMFGYDEMPGFISGPTGSGSSSFTALLELPPPQAVELLVKDDYQAPPPIFPTDVALVDRASKFSVFATGEVDFVKQEPLDSENSEPAVSDQSGKSNKRKEREKKVKETNKKSKKVLAKEGGNGEKLPYVHVRARRGQATDSHSLAERARREKINARMKLLQELVPGCNKISGTAMVLDEIINHVQALQRQVEFLSMRLAAVNPRIDFNLDALLAAESASSMDNMYPGTFAPPIWPEGHIHGIKQQQFQQQLWNIDALQPPVWGRGDDTANFITPENSLLSYDSSGHSASLHSNQLKMEL